MFTDCYKYNIPFKGISIFFLFYTSLFSQEKNPYISILLAGDTHFNLGIKKLQKESSTFTPVEKIKDTFMNVDYRIINLESVISNVGYPISKKRYIFHSSTKEIALLKYLKINLSILANNHSMDMGLLGLKNMRSSLAKNDIATVGAGQNQKEAQKEHSFSLQKAKTKINFSLWAATKIGKTITFSKKNKGGIANKIDLEKLSKSDQNTQKIVSLHWGREYFLRPTNQQISFAHKLIHLGANVIIGHHPHIPQGIEIYKQGVILYSLGNFLFGTYNELQENNILAILDFSVKTKKLERVRLLPITGQYKKQGHQVRLLDEKEFSLFWKKFFLLTKQLSPKTAKKLYLEDNYILLNCKENRNISS